MKRSTKVTSIIIVFFLIIAGVIIGRTMIGMHFEKKFSNDIFPNGIPNISAEIKGKKLLFNANKNLQEPVVTSQ